MQKYEIKVKNDIDINGIETNKGSNLVFDTLRDIKDGFAIDLPKIERYRNSVWLCKSKKKIYLILKNI